MRQLQQLATACLIVLTAGDSAAPPLTPQQTEYLANVAKNAAPASEKAEAQLLGMFRSVKFRAGLMMQGAWKLAFTPANELMAQLKGTLAAIEYTSNFGVDPEWRKAHPGEPSMGFETIDSYGYIPNMWELRAHKSPLVDGVPLAQWKILESAESGLYQLPLTSKPLPIGPDATQALERPQYIAGNLRRTDIGIARYGSYAAVLRNDVIRDRAAILPTDSGGWENICNNSDTPIHKWFIPVGRTAARCDGVKMDSSDRPIPGTTEHQMHTILGNTKVFGKLGGSLSRLMYQLLTPGATTRPFETLFYTEAGLLGPLRPADMKLMVASFPGVFGSVQATALRLFCLTHRIPLAWALNRGETFTQSTAPDSVLQWMPFAPVSVPVGPDRIIDPLTWAITNVTMDLPDAMKKTWAAIFNEIENKRGEAATLQSSEYISWWNRLSVLGGHVEPLHQGECDSADTCFGTYLTKEGTKDCLCKDSKTMHGDDNSVVSEARGARSPDTYAVVV